jgi:hypothetical protein
VEIEVSGAAVERDVRNAVDEAMIGAAAIGFCLARALADHDPGLAGRLAPAWKKMYRYLQERGEMRAADMVFMFGAAVANPQIFENQLPNGCERRWKAQDNTAQPSR